MPTAKANHLSEHEGIFELNVMVCCSCLEAGHYFGAIVSGMQQYIKLKKICCVHVVSRLIDHSSNSVMHYSGWIQEINLQCFMVYKRKNVGHLHRVKGFGI